MLQGRSNRDVTVPTSTQNAEEPYTYHPIQIDWLGPQPPSVSSIVSTGRYHGFAVVLLIIHHSIRKRRDGGISELLLIKLVEII